MDSNSAGFVSWLTSFIDQFFDILGNTYILGYNLIEIFIGCSIITFLISHLYLGSHMRAGSDRYGRDLKR